MGRKTCHSMSVESIHLKEDMHPPDNMSSKIAEGFSLYSRCYKRTLTSVT